MATVDKSRLNALTIRYLLDTLSVEERQELDVLLDEDPLRRQRFMERVENSRLEQKLSAYLEMEKRREGRRQAAVRKITIKRLIPYAAALLLAVAATVFWITRHPGGQESATTGMARDYLPGSNRATLILADGSRIDLDAAKNGDISTQGDSRIRKTDSDRIIYQAENGKTIPGHAGLTYNTVATPRGGTYQVVLPDGSVAWLNAASSIRFPVNFAHNRRDVEITGEVYFNIRNHPSQPFYVNSPGASVQVLGTEFNVQVYTNEPTAQVTLLQGSILVSAGVPSGAKKIQLAPGQQAVVSSGSLAINDKADIQQAIAWKTGFFKFNNADIRSVMREVERWYDVEISYQLTDFSMKYGGRISRNLKLSELLRLLEGNNIHHYKMEGRKLIVLP